MKTISEVGHSKNVANLEDLISYCTAFGATYSPGLVALQLASLTTLKTTADAAITTIVSAVTNYKTAVSNRQIAFKNLKQLAPRIISALKACGASPQTLANANTIYKKLMGRTKKVSSSNLPKIAKTIDSVPLTSVTISTSQQSYDSRIEFFTALIDLVSNVSSYNPNETTLNVTSLNSFLTNLKTVNTAVITTTTTLDNARSNRNIILYKATTGLVIIAREVKNYIASIYGKSSNEFKNVNKIKFKLFKY